MGVCPIIEAFPMKKCIDSDAVINRLKRIEGQVRGIIRMVEEDAPCEDILIQIGSAKAALHKTGQVVLEGHLSHCIIDGIKEGKEKETISRLSSAIEQFSRIV
jgi:DNA-binding FrmR family transcriptional regulator